MKSHRHVTALGSWTNSVIALRHISVTALFCLEDSRRIHPRRREASGGACLRAGWWGACREREKERVHTWESPLAALFVCFYGPALCKLGSGRSAVLPEVLTPVLGPSFDFPLLYFRRLFPSCFLATAIWTPFPSSNYLTHPTTLPVFVSKATCATHQALICSQFWKPHIEGLAGPQSLEALLEGLRPALLLASVSPAISESPLVDTRHWPALSRHSPPCLHRILLPPGPSVSVVLLLFLQGPQSCGLHDFILTPVHCQDSISKSGPFTSTQVRISVHLWGLGDTVSLRTMSRLPSSSPHLASGSEWEPRPALSNSLVPSSSSPSFIHLPWAQLVGPVVLDRSCKPPPTPGYTHQHPDPVRIRLPPG